MLLNKKPLAPINNEHVKYLKTLDLGDIDEFIYIINDSYE